MDPDIWKRCSVCGERKPLNDFYRAVGMADGHRNDCKLCNLAAKKRRTDANPEPARRRARDWAAANPERVAVNRERWKTSGRQSASGRRAHLKRTFALTEEAYAAMVEAQGGRCAICRQPPGEGKNLDVDHDHRTGRVRGGLCRQCNHGLGLFRDDLSSLLAAVEYLTGARLDAELTFLPPGG